MLKPSNGVMKKLFSPDRMEETKKKTLVKPTISMSARRKPDSIGPLSRAMKRG